MRKIELERPDHTCLSIYLSKALRDQVSLIAMAERGRDVPLSTYIREVLQDHVEENYGNALEKIHNMLLEVKAPTD